METTTQERGVTASEVAAQQRAGSLEPQQDNRPAANLQASALSAANPMGVIEFALEKGVAPEQLSQLMDLAERQQKKMAEQAFNRAMAAFKAEAPILDHDKHVKYNTTEYTHSSLAHILEVVLPIMSKHGLSHQWFTGQESGGVVSVTCRLSHVDGHFHDVKLFSNPDNSGGKNGIQAVGSAVSYLQRYTFLAITGLATRNNPDEDDGRGAEQAAQQKPAQQQRQRQAVERPIVEGGITPSQLKQLREKAKAAGITEQDLCGIARVEKLEYLRADRLQGAMAYLDQQGANQQ